MAATMMANHNDINNNTAFNAIQINAPAEINAPLSIIINTDSFAELLKSLDPYDFEHDRTVRSSKRTPNTCEWIAHERLFQEWVKTEEQRIWIFGKPGSGKTFIADYVCSYLKNSKAARMYFFFDSDNPEVRTLDRFYRTCLHQLLGQVAHNDRDRILAMVHKEVSGVYQKPRLVANAIKEVLKEFGSGYLIIDAVDECQDPKELVANLFKDLAEIPTLKIMITSRPLGNMTAIADGNLQLQLSSVTDKSDRDIQLYVQHRIKELTHEIAMPEVEKRLVSKSKSMILYAKVMLDLLDETAAEDEQDLLEELEKIPHDLSKIYAATLKKISVDSTKQFVLNVIRWLSVCKRPPSLGDLWAVHTIQRTTKSDGEFQYDSSRVPNRQLFRRNLVRHCVPLVEIVGKDETVSFIHTTVREFLEGKKIESEDDEKCPQGFRIDVVESHGFAFVTCISYLRLDLDVLKDTKPDFVNTQSFREYAVTKWERHCEKSQSGETDVMASFCGDDAVFRAWLDCRAALDRAFRLQFAIDSDSGSVYPSPLHIVVYFSLFKVARFFLDSCAYEVNCVDAADNTPLHVAAARGSEDFVRRLIAAGAQIEMTDKNGSLPLHRAVRHGNYDAVRALIEGDDPGPGIMAVDSYGFTPLAIACQLGWEKCVKILLPQLMSGSDISKTAIGYAVENGHHSIVQHLLDWDGSLINHCEEPWLAAARKGQVEMVKLLIERGVNISCKDKQGQTALHKASISGETKLTKFFIETLEMPPDPTDNSQRTPLYFAAERGYTEIVDCLIENKANVNALDRRRETPLFKPAGNGHERIVDRLLVAGTDATILDHWQRTPLRFAAMKGRVKIVKMLLERTNIQQDLPDWTGRTVLQTAASFLRDGQEGVIDLLIEHGAQPERKTGQTGGGTALHEAIRRETGQPPPTEALVRRLIKVGVPVNQLDSSGKSALYYANLSGNVAIAKALKDEGAIPDSARTPPPSTLQDQAMGLTPIHLAILSGEDEFVHAMLQTEYGRNAITRQDKDGRTVIHLAAERGRTELLSVLLGHLTGQRAAAVDLTDVNGSTALHLAASQGQFYNVKRLLDFGALAYATDNGRYMPMHFAAVAGHDEIVLELLNALPSQVEQHLPTWMDQLPEQLPSHSDSNLPQPPIRITASDTAFFNSLYMVGAIVKVREQRGNIFYRVANVWMPDNRLSLISRIVKELETWESYRHSVPSTVLMRAIFSGRIEVVKQVLHRIPHMPLQAEQYMYPNSLTAASALGHAEIVDELIKAGALVDAVADSQESALHYAARNGRAKVIELLLDPHGTKGANPDLARLSDGSTPLHLAAEGGHNASVRALANVAFLNATDDLGRTPLHRACLSKQETTVGVLLEFAVDVLVKDENSATPMSLAKNAGFGDDLLQRLQDEMDKQRLN